MGCSESTPEDTVVNPKCVDITHFEVQRVIGKGGFGKVYAVVKRSGTDKDESYALKKYHKEELLRHKGGVAEIVWELSILAGLSSQWLCNARYAFQSPSHCYLVMDLALGGDLRYHLKNHSMFPEAWVQQYLAQTFLALEYLHSKKILHRDLKPDNIIIDDEGFLKLTDMGISAKLHGGVCKKGSGTPGYMGPELYTPSRKHSYSSDWWALGIVAHELLTGRKPIPAKRLADHRLVVEEEELKLDAPSYPSPVLDLTTPAGQSMAEDGDVVVSEACYLFVQQLLRKNPEKRLGFGGSGEVKGHAFFEGFDWKALENRRIEVPMVPDTHKSNVNMELQLAVAMGEESGVTEQQNVKFAVPDDIKAQLSTYHYHTSPKGVSDGQSQFFTAKLKGSSLYNFGSKMRFSKVGKQSMMKRVVVTVGSEKLAAGGPVGDAAPNEKKGGGGGKRGG